jgi:hypothetical protein
MFEVFTLKSFSMSIDLYRSLINPDYTEIIKKRFCLQKSISYDIYALKAVNMNIRAFLDVWTV